jgi:hypothetical protein
MHWSAGVGCLVLDYQHVTLLQRGLLFVRDEYGVHFGIHHLLPHFITSGLACVFPLVLILSCALQPMYSFLSSQDAGSYQAAVAHPITQPRFHEGVDSRQKTHSKKPRMNTAPCSPHTPSQSVEPVPFNGKTSGTLRAHRDRRTSWARTACCRQRAVCGRTGRAPA